jgi:hypothetical protein
VSEECPPPLFWNPVYYEKNVFATEQNYAKEERIFE